MELTYATIVVLASMIFVLAGMVGYLYWQQTRMMQHLNSIAIVISTHFAPRPVQEEEEEEEPVKEEKQEESETEEEDDRVSVKDEVEVVEGPKEEAKPVEEDIDDLQDKTAAQLRELLTKKGIPFGKRDPKTVLIQLLKATA
jgi:outer membrane biosynthesis protein TonB